MHARDLIEKLMVQEDQDVFTANRSDTSLGLLLNAFILCFPLVRIILKGRIEEYYGYLQGLMELCCCDCRQSKVDRIARDLELCKQRLGAATDVVDDAATQTEGFDPSKISDDAVISDPTEGFGTSGVEPALGGPEVRNWASFGEGESITHTSVDLEDADDTTTPFADVEREGHAANEPETGFFQLIIENWLTPMLTPRGLNQVDYSTRQGSHEVQEKREVSGADLHSQSETADDESHNGASRLSLVV
jgi:hypothetical protein